MRPIARPSCRAENIYENWRAPIASVDMSAAAGLPGKVMTLRIGSVGVQTSGLPWQPDEWRDV